MTKHTDNFEAKLPQKHIDKTADYKSTRDRELVRGRFHYHQRPGGTLKFNYYEAKGDSERPVVLKDGEVYELERKVARHLNNSGLVPKYEWFKDATGLEAMRLARKERRYSFENYDFFELDDIGPAKPIITDM
jgi:hypothetical protein